MRTRTVFVRRRLGLGTIGAVARKFRRGSSFPAARWGSVCERLLRAQAPRRAEADSRGRRPATYSSSSPGLSSFFCSPRLFLKADGYTPRIFLLRFYYSRARFLVSLSLSLSLFASCASLCAHFRLLARPCLLLPRRGENADVGERPPWIFNYHSVFRWSFLLVRWGTLARDGNYDLRDARVCILNMHAACR